MPADGAGAVTGSGAGGGASNPTTDDETPPDEPDPATLGDGGPDVGVIGSEGADGGASTVLPGCEPPTQYANLFESHLDRSRAEVDAKVEGAFQQLFHGGSNQTIYYESGDGAYILDVNSNDIRSEGQSYGMMVAVQLDKKEEFDRIWRWTARVMQQASGRIGWQASTSGQLYSSGSAPDGEEYIATALIFASTRWGDDTGINYAEEATRVLAAMYDEGLFDHEQQLVKFVTTSNYTDPSYILPTFYEVWACFDGEAERAAFWKAAAETGRAFFPKTVNSSTGLAPYLANWDGGARGDFNADSYRVVANIMMDHNLYKVDPWQTSFAETYAAFFEDAQQSSNPGAEFRLDGSVIAAYGAPEPALAAQNAMVAFGVPVEQGRYFVEYLWDMDIPSGQYRYYSGCLYMLSLLHVGGLFHLYH
jgi:endo-1,4-beta-D-glucanase Y